MMWHRVIVIVSIVLFFSGSKYLFSEENHALLPRSFSNYPKGVNFDGDVQFDTIIVLNAPIAQTRIAIFSRYYVSKNEISYDIFWTEPAWMSVNFPYPPFELSGNVDSSDFRLSAFQHDKTWNYRLQNSSRGVFPHVLNGYDIADQRFSYIEYKVVRLDDYKFSRINETATTKLFRDRMFPAYSTKYNWLDDRIDITRTETYGPDISEAIISKKRSNTNFSKISLKLLRRICTNMIRQRVV